jgi:hypothetical protein
MTTTDRIKKFRGGRRCRETTQPSEENQKEGRAMKRIERNRIIKEGRTVGEAKREESSVNDRNTRIETVQRRGGQGKGVEG